MTGQSLRRRLDRWGKTPKERRRPCGGGRQRLEGSVCKPRNAKDRWQPPEAGREERDRMSLRASRRTPPCQRPDFTLLVSRAGRQ